MKHTDTIAAISTAISNSGIGVIRISGTDAISVADSCFVSKNEKFRLLNAKANTIHYGFIIDNNETIDEVLAFVFKAPHSFTAEDTVEISCHGGAFVMQKILEIILKNGARFAEPGEFSKRAFLNGRIDLSKAEAIMDIINSDNELILKNSVNQLKGSLYREICDIREILLHETAYIEAAIDDPENYSLDNYGDNLKEIIDKTIIRIEKLLDSSKNGLILKDGVNTVILGKPNAGKSSLLNLLAGTKRAIVTDIEGTTRDILTEKVNINGISLNIYDTAGIREADNEIEKIGVDLAINAANNADLILYVIDSIKNIDDIDKKILNNFKDKKVILLWNKFDLNKNDSVFEYSNYINIMFSTKTEVGFEELKNIIYDLFIRNDISCSNGLCVTNIRHKDLIEQARNSLLLVLDGINNCVSEDLYSIDLYDAYSSLGLIIGEEVDDDLVNKIFSDFCMGK